MSQKGANPDRFEEVRPVESIAQLEIPSSAGDLEASETPDASTTILEAADLANLSVSIAELQEQIIDAANALSELVNTSDVSALLARVDNLQAASCELETKVELARSLLTICRDVTHMRFSERAELAETISLPNDINFLTFARQPLSTIRRQLEETATLLSQIRAYDAQRLSLKQEIAALRVAGEARSAELARWLGGTGEADPVSSATPPSDEMDTLLSLRNRLASVNHEIKAIERRTNDQRNNLQRRIEQYMTDLAQLNTDHGTEVLPKLTLGGIQAQQVIDSGPEFAHEVIQGLSDLYVRSLAALRDQQAMDLANAALSNRDAEATSELIALLTRRNGQMEALLLHLVGQMAKTGGALSAPDGQAVEEMLLAWSGLFGEQDALRLLSEHAPLLMGNWAPSDDAGLGHIAVALLLSVLGNPKANATDTLWLIGKEFPLPSMPSWSRLWRALVGYEPVRLIDRSEEAARVQLLNASRTEAHTMLTKDISGYVRARAAKSSAHHQVMNQFLLPPMDQFLTELERLEAQFEEAEFGLRPRIQADVGKALDDFRRQSDPQSINEKYETAAEPIILRDSDPFHKRQSIHVLQQTAIALDAYAAQLLVHMRIHSVACETAYVQDLLSELETGLPSCRWETATLQSIGPTNLVYVSSGSEPSKIAKLADALVVAILSDPYLAFHTPRTIGWLTRDEWLESTCLNCLLEDIANPPLTHDEAARKLLELGAPSQALLLAQQIQLSLQKQAQSEIDRFERELEALRVEVLKAGGEWDRVVDECVRIGRWGLAIFWLRSEADERKRQQEEQHARIRQQQRAFLQSTHEREVLAFEMQDTVSREIVEPVTRILNKIKSALARRNQPESIPVLFQWVTDFFEQYDHMHRHQEWHLAKLAGSEEQIDNILERGTPNRPEATTLQAIQETLTDEEKGEGERSGRPLDTENSPVAETETSQKLVELLLWLKNAAFAPTEYPGGVIKDSLIDLFKTFAKMTIMVAPPSTGGRNLYANDTVSGVFELKYPKSRALEGVCRFVALGGDPPETKHANALIQAIDEERWLDEGFVFVFAPGADSRILSKLRNQFQGQPLLVLDEPTLTAIVTADSERHPLGVLRARMLNAKGGAEAEVFHYNDTVRRRTAIFVGRDYLISKISGSSHNWAIFGGRRIGKSSLLLAIEENLSERPNQRVVFHSMLSTAGDQGDDALAAALWQNLSKRLRLSASDPLRIVRTVEEFRQHIQQHLDSNPDDLITIMIDEIDQYLSRGKSRHQIIEAFRALADRNPARFRVILAGFTLLYDCLQGRGPYAPESDPWTRMFTDPKPLPNLNSIQAENLIKEGFYRILGWQFERSVVPQMIVQRTSGHPAFVQHFCRKLQEIVGARGDRMIRIDDVERVFADKDPNYSFRAYVRNTFVMNLDSVSQYLIYNIAREAEQSRRFTIAQLQDYARLNGDTIPEDQIKASLDKLNVTGVVHESTRGVYEFAVPDYPLLLKELGETKHLEDLENQVLAAIGVHHA